MVRLTGTNQSGHWHQRWCRALAQLLFPPLLLLTTAIAILWMGPHGQMVWAWEGWLSYGLAMGFLGWAGLGWLWFYWQGKRTLQQIRAYPQTYLQGQPLRILELPLPYSAQVGFWQPELVISQSLLATMDAAHLRAILLHEQAHYHYRDTFWFFWLGWAKRLCPWLPQSESLWQELLLLRELRADRWAAQHTDALLLAEVLLQMVSSAAGLSEPVLNDNVCVAFSRPAPPSRLMQRIDALFTELESPPQPESQPVSRLASWLMLALLPLAAIPFHN
jgi:Zn-dependent protease with chaperone function